MPNIFFFLKDFNFNMSLNLNMVCYHIQLIEYLINLWMIILLWGKVCYKHLPMVVSNLPDIFQYKMNHFLKGF